MLDIVDIRKVISQMRKIGADTQTCEVKEAVQAIPKSLTETISAFSNKAGGLILLGLSEKNDFKPVPNFDAQKIYSQLQTIGDQLTPRVRLEIELIPFESSTIVAAYVPSTPANQRPCFITNRGQYEGAFIRSGDGDRHLSAYEVDRLIEVRTPPKFDIEPVENATIDDLNPETLQKIVDRVRLLFPRIFGRLEKEVILIQLGVLTRLEDTLRPTLAGLLVAGIFPQRYFPRLQIVFTVYPGTTKAGDPVTGQRYLDSKELVGSIPDMLLDTLSLVQQRMSTGAIVEGGLRKDVPDYPIVALREAIANALQHRDYSPEGRGTHVQVNMYSDRIEVSNPGGLYGATTVESLGKEGISASRNEFLSRLLTYTPFLDGYVVENKGTGFMTIESELARALMPPPTVKNSLTFFSLSFEKRRMSKPERSKRPNSLDETIIRAIHANGDLSIKELVAMSGMSRTSISQHVRQLVETKILEPLENIRSPKQRYRLIVGRS